MVNGKWIPRKRRANCSGNDSEVVANITNRYIELYEHITGTKFEKADSTNILARIENNVNECLASLK